jgi:hypothetical protein
VKPQSPEKLLERQARMLEKLADPTLKVGARRHLSRALARLRRRMDQEGVQWRR